MNPIVETDQLSKWYGQVIGINDITLQIQPGITGLLGPNGAGKSTLLKLMTGQIKPSKGSLKVLGEPVWNNHRLNRRIGFCPDQDSFYERLSGLEFVRYLAELHGYSRRLAQTKALEAIEKVDLLDMKDKKIGAYSKGMRQRIKLAQALMHEPELLLLDEPLNGMDPIGRRKIIRLLHELRQNGVSLIVSSHILHEIEAITNTIILIHNGKILAEGDIQDIRSLIDAHPHNVRISCDKPRLLASILMHYDDVVSVRLDHNNGDIGDINVETAKPNEFYARLPKLLLEHQVEVERLSSPDDNLQAVFDYLVH